MIKLPKAVGEELEMYKHKFEVLEGTEYSFDNYVYDALTLPYTGFIHSTYLYLKCEVKADENTRIVNLLMAWVRGWEEE